MGWCVFFFVLGGGGMMTRCELKVFFCPRKTHQAGKRLIPFGGCMRSWFIGVHSLCHHSFTNTTWKLQGGKLPETPTNKGLKWHF